jgi:hypothetical protein
MPLIRPEQYCNTDSEHAHQSSVFLYFKNAAYENKKLNELDRVKIDNLWWSIDHIRYIDEMMFAIPNGGERGKGEAARLKLEGVKAGIPDICLPMPVEPYCGLFIEMKKPGREKESQGGCSNKQMEKIHHLTSQMYKVSVCYSWKSAVEEIHTYLYGDK